MYETREQDRIGHMADVMQMGRKGGAVPPGTSHACIERAISTPHLGHARSRTYPLTHARAQDPGMRAHI